MSLCVYSFMKDAHLVLDASIAVTAQRTADIAAAADAANTRVEALWPELHKITLPFNLLNSLFSDVHCVINNHTQLTADR